MKRRSLINIKKLLIIATFTFLFANSALAQKSIGIAAVVNDDIISVYDVKARMDIIIATSGIKDSIQSRKKLLPQVIRNLVNERLKIQEAKKNDITVNSDEIKRAYHSVEMSNNMPKGTLKETLLRSNLDIDSYNQQIKAKIAWAKLVRRKLKRSVSVGDDEVNEKLKKIKQNIGKPSMYVYEIFLPVEDIRKDEEALNLAKKIKEHVNQGADFRTLARQFSKSATAANGGKLGWVYYGQLEKELDKALTGLKVGEISKPVRTISGYYLLYLKDKQILKEFDKKNMKLTLNQIFLPNEMKEEKKQTIIKAINQAEDKSCDRFDTISKRYELKNSGKIENVIISKIPPVIRQAVENLEVGNVSDKIKMQNGNAYIMLCDREKTSNIPTKEMIKKDLENKRLELLARNMLHDIKRASIIEFRR